MSLCPLPDLFLALQELLSKAGIGAQDKITKEDLNISVLQSLTWPILYGSKVEKTKDDLQNFYSRVSVTILTYQIRTRYVVCFFMSCAYSSMQYFERSKDGFGEEVEPTVGEGDVRQAAS